MSTKILFSYILVLFIYPKSGFCVVNESELLFRKLVEINDRNIPNLISTQNTDPRSRFYGCSFDADSLVSPVSTAGFIQSLVCSYVSPASAYYKSPDVLKKLELAGEGLLRMQHDDGTIDLLSTNFHSTPDLGFTIYPIAASYSILLKNKELNFGKLPELLKNYMLNAGKALTVGGVHTPNHRWAICGALAWINSFFPNPAYKNRIDQWLAEKIDMDPDGQYNERSTAVYTPVTNRSLLEIAKRMGYTQLYETVRKNLDLTFYFVHSNGELVTESSNRQDKYQIVNMAGYFLAYHTMALLDNDSRYAGMAQYILQNVSPGQLDYMLPYFIDNQNLTKEYTATSPLPDNYHKFFRYSDIVRIRRGNTDLSVINKNPAFFTFFKGNAALEAIRLSSAFFGKGQFQSDSIKKQGDSYVLSAYLEGPYYQPLSADKIPAVGEAWGAVPRSTREKSEIQKLRTTITITESGGKARIKIVADGPENLPVSVEFAFRRGGKLTNVTPKKGIDNAYLARNGHYIEYQKETEKIKIGPALATHNWTQLRGALPKLQADCVYFTGYAPCVFEFTVE